jgi:hypothetical protein
MRKFGVLAALAVAANVSAEEVRVPCSDGPSGFLRSCAEFFDGKAGRKGFKELLRERMKSDIAHLYQGKRVDVLATTDPANPQGPGYPTPVCNVLPNEFNQQQPEGDSNATAAPNHLGQSCGQFVHLDVNVDWVCWGCPRVSEVTLDFVPPYGRREAAFQNGAFPAALNCFYQEILRELETTRKMKVEPTSACASLGKDIAGLGDKSADVAKGVQNALGGASGLNPDEIWKCETSTWENTQVTGRTTGVDVGKLRQSAQYLCSARGSMEGAFMQLAVCEIYARAGRSYRNVFGDAQAFQQELRTKVAEKVKGDCGGCASEGCADSCANEKYKTRFLDFIRDKFRTNWPANPDSSNRCVLPTAQRAQDADGGLPLLAFVGMLGRGRPGRRRRAGLAAAANAAALAAAVYLSTGCGGDTKATPICGKGGQLANNCPCPTGNLNQFKAECCDANGDQIKFDGNCSANVTPEDTGTTGAGALGGISAGGAMDDIGSALSTFSNNPSNRETGGETPEQMLAQTASAATEGGPAGPQKKTDAKAEGTGLNPAITLPKGKDGKGSGAGAGVALGAAGLSIPRGETEASGPGGDARTAAAVSQADSGATPGQGGGVPGGAGGEGGGDYRRVDPGAGGGAPLSFGSEGGAADAPVSGSEDPLDYFTRTALDENLFKKVEKRYDEKELSWLRDDSRRKK